MLVPWLNCLHQTPRFEESTMLGESILLGKIPDKEC